MRHLHIALSSMGGTVQWGLVYSVLPLQAPGDGIEEYDIIMEVDTQELTEAAYKVGKFAGSVTLLVEAQVQQASHNYAAWALQNKKHTHQECHDRHSLNPQGVESRSPCRAHAC